MRGLKSFAKRLFPSLDAMQLESALQAFAAILVEVLDPEVVVHVAAAEQVPGDNATTRNARYEIWFNNYGNVTQSINQNAYYDTWVSLGTYYFSSASYKVSLTDATGEPAGA